MYLDNISSGGEIARKTIGLISEQEQMALKFESLRERAHAKKLLYRAFSETGPLTHQYKYVEGGGRLYEITTGGAQVVVEIMEERGEIIESKKDLNRMGRKPIRI